MSGTSAAGAFRVEDWEHEAFAADDVSPSSSKLGSDIHDRAYSLTQIPGFPAVDLSVRSLTDALAEMGPAQPGNQMEAESWSCAAQPGEQIAGYADASDIPPPRRPFRELPFFVAEDELAALSQSYSHVAGGLSHAGLGGLDAANVELVRLLAEADLAREERSRDPVVSHATDTDMMGPAPIIIERAKAEKELGVLPALPPVPWANPVHGLLVGFSLSLVTGAVIYTMLLGG